jgi:general secretion pathway protein G
MLTFNKSDLLNTGYTIVEVLIAMAIVATLSAIAVPVGTMHIDKARNARAILEIRTLEKDIASYEMKNETYPDSLSDIGRGGLHDPWGNPYQYLKIAGATIPGPGGGGGGSSIMDSVRKDRFLVPVNTDYDLYSMGKDGKSHAPFTAPESLDDIARANNGGYVGIAANF